MKTVPGLSLGAVMMASGVLSACGVAASRPASSASGPPALQTLYEAAKKEGEVIWVANEIKAAADDIDKAFTARYPGVKATFNPANEPQIPAQVITEATNGARVVKSIDVGHGSPTQFLPLYERDLLLSPDWASFGVDPSRSRIGGKWLVNEDNVDVWIYNTDTVAPADVPTQWQDLLKARWKGKKIVTNASAAGLSQLFMTMGEDKAHDFLTALKGQDLLVTKSRGPAREMVANGQAQLTVTGVKDLVDLKRQGAQVDGIPALGPMARDERGWYLPKQTQHPNAAQLFIAWIVTPEGWKLQQQAGLDIAVPCGASDVAKYVCDSGLQYMDVNSSGLDLFAYYSKLNHYQDLAREVLQLKPE